MKLSYVYRVALTLVLAILLVKFHVSMAVDCDIMELKPCLDYLDRGSPAPSPDSECCHKLHQQESCLCDFVKNPKYRRYFKYPEAKRIAKVCRITIPDPKTCK